MYIYTDICACTQYPKLRAYLVGWPLDGCFRTRAADVCAGGVHAALKQL